MHLFSKSIAPTDITTNIEKATSSVSELDRNLVSKICSSVNSSEMGAKEARKLLQKKMISDDPNTQILALEILNSLFENCADKFPQQLAAKSFGVDLCAFASSKNKEDKVHGKLEQCLNTWAGQTRGDSQYGAIERALDIMNKRQDKRQAPRQFRSTHGNTPREPLKPAEVKGDIEFAKNNAQVFSETLSFTDPTKEDISKNKLIQEFYSNCKHAQQMLASHLVTCEAPEIITALIYANNELLSCFESYDEMLEQATVNQATVNSQSLHNRTSRNDEQIKQQDLISSSSQHQTQYSSPSLPAADATTTAATHSHNPYRIHTALSNDPFDPFADTNQASIDTTNAGALPPPLIPQKMHK